MTHPASIHDPISPSQAKHLPGWFWNVRPELEARKEQTRKERQRQQSHESYLRAKARRQGEA